MNRRLYRSRTDTILGGVAAGLASYLNADPALVRIAWAILVPLTGGAALIAYIVGWIVVPAAHVVVGVNYLSADADRAGSIGSELSSSFHDFSTTADLRLAIFRWHRLEPFVGAGIGVHFLGNDIAGDGTLHERYSGTKLGAQFFGGTAIDLTSDRTWSGYLELRRIEVPHVGRTTVRLGAFVRI